MFVLPDTRCRVCRKVFCCADCRHKHELKTHAIPVRRSKSGSSIMIDCEANNNIIYLFCPLCEKRPLPLREEMYDELMAHIATNHLPLHCHKCTKIYTRVEDLRNFSKCLQPLVACGNHEEPMVEEGGEDMADQTCDTDASKVTVKRAVAQQTTISTQTSPMAAGAGLSAYSGRDADNLTPISMMNLRWQTKSKLMHETFGGDSVSSLKNISSICGTGSVYGQCVKGKLVRSTSTPVHAQLCVAKPKEQTFNGSGGHVSSIYHSGNDSDNHSPAALQQASNAPPSPCQQQPADPVGHHHHYRKVAGRGKLAAHTPLRQVMSRSIQKALVEHGLPPAGAVAGSPLDLRLSPALRRTQSAVSHCYDADVSTAGGAAALLLAPANRVCREILLSSSTKQLTTTESIVITRMRHLDAGSSGHANAAAQSTAGSFSNCSVGESSSAMCSSNSSSSSCGGSGASVYQTCRSVEIITSTELTAEEVYTTAKERTAIVLGAEQALAVYTPITRIPGAIIHKKVINFETPQGELSVSTSAVAAAIQSPKTAPGSAANFTNIDPNVSSPGGERFFTPSATPSGTPMRKASQSRPVADDARSEERRRSAVPRNLSGRFAAANVAPRYGKMRGRPSYQRTESNPNQSRDDGRVTNDENAAVGDGDDEVFWPPLYKRQQSQPLLQPEQPKKIPPVGRSWSLGALMSSMMRLPALRTSSGSEDPASKLPYAGSLIKRCASIAGSLVRTKTLPADDNEHEQLKSMKRKRTNTLDGQYAAPASSPPSSGGSQSPSSPGGGAARRSGQRMHAASKRVRIQPRKPIERMRLNS